MLFLINKITPVRIDSKEQLTGVDEIMHGENAYLM
jgi:ammonia channel protein AmtB